MRAILAGMKMPTAICLATLALAGAAAQAVRLPAHGRVDSLVKIDTELGAGRLAMHGNTVSVHYGAWLYAPAQAGMRGAAFDSSPPTTPMVFKLGAGSVIKGWDDGVRGMRVGGKRTLVVPSAMAFGKAGRASVPPGANLIFEIELVDVR
jgi:FKBP-type peptidyl-prolyl cis-trans isomerase FkpA